MRCVRGVREEDGARHGRARSGQWVSITSYMTGSKLLHNVLM